MKNLKYSHYFLWTTLAITGTLSCKPPQTEETGPANTTKKEATGAIEITPENHDDKMSSVLGTPKHNIRSIGILVYDGVNILDVMGPRYVLGQVMGAKTELIAVNPGNIKTVMGVELVPNTVMDSVDQLDILVVPGGFKGTLLGAYDSRIHQWIKKIDQTSTYTTSVCTGGWILGAAGLLKGRKATTNWYQAEEMLKRYGATFVKERYVNDGKYWTSAGVTAGMDMSLAILNDLYGENYTQAVMLDMEYDPAPPIKGGSPEKTVPEVYQMMEAMYAMGIVPLLDSLDGVIGK
ncbi:DJ-1/PfpI family protein [Fulvivirga sp. M361]|uniref:DJ-1/PfpI family protein n=1 Tax=Fulvivirga sp. M361 TaxID=2594266 RepID=UPI00117992E9|nr:DJ-1/PfpI family protein [Fulvivirga sp. M361]TRX58818.1 DJ-1/PfpI family protein [Fulvivirga sp. M361]